jgi:hypothetical protein
MALRQPFQDPSTQAYYPTAVWDLADVQLQLSSRQATITLWVWFNEAAWRLGYLPIAKLEPRTLRPDEFDAPVILEQMPAQTTLTDATKMFATQLIRDFPEFAGAQLVV